MKERKTKATKANGKSEPVAEPAAPEPTAAPAPAPEAAPEAAPEPETKAAAGVPKPGDKIDLEGFGGEVETNDSRKVTLKALVEESKEGVVLFTSWTQHLRAEHGFAQGQHDFQGQAKLPYPLLCNPSASLIGAIGLKKAPKGTTRGVFVVKKNGEVLAAEPGGPAATLDVVKAVVEKMGGSGVGEKAEARAAQAEKEESKDGEAAKL
ncbi:unnamed protein product [Aureobasidium pullulans]|nr:unnamed protein product [Aureobasidium pullulans]